MAEKKVVSGSTPKGGSPSNEFFRGEEAIFNGGDQAIVSPVASIFKYPHTAENALDKGLREQSGGKQR